MSDRDVHTEYQSGETVGTEYIIRNGMRGHIRWAHITYTSTGTAGNRQLVFRFKDDADNVIYDIRAGATQAASLVRHYAFCHGVVRESSFQGGSEILSPLPHLQLVTNFKLQVIDENSVDAADTFDIAFQSVE